MTTKVTVENPHGNGWAAVILETSPEMDGVARTFETVVPPGATTELHVWPQKKVTIFERPLKEQDNG